MRVLHVEPGHAGAWTRAEEDALDEAVRLLRAGELVAFPTETVYGLGARALDRGALAKVFEAKGRPKGHPLIAHVLGEADGAALAAEWSERASRLARAFWPGPLTLVVPRAAHVPNALTGGADSVAVRAPSHPVARALLARLGEPIAAPSANRYQSISPTRAEHVAQSLGDRVPLVLDGGACDAGIESTVIDVRGARARLLRPGALPIPALRAVEPGLDVTAATVADESATRASPGMDPRHYAPRTPLRILPDRAALSRELARCDPTHHVVFITHDPYRPFHPCLSVHYLASDPVGYAHALFAMLHTLDAFGYEEILIEAVPDDEAWAGVADRLKRASSP